MFSESLNKYLSEFTYNLKDVTDHSLNFIKMNKSKDIKLNVNFELNIKYPGLLYLDDGYMTKYNDKIYNGYKYVYTPPRGFIDKTTNVIVGIAPSHSRLSFGESAWLLGPSSKRLHELLGANFKYYFTNVCKEPFPFNRYNESLIEESIWDIVKEIAFFNGCKIVFLGKYDIYDRIVDILKLKNYIKICHPAYLRYIHKINIKDEKVKLLNFLECK